MAEGERIGAAYVDIGADLSNFDAAVDALPRKAGSKMDAAMKALQAQVARNKLELKIALNTGTAADIARIGAEQSKLEAKIDAVTAAAVRQAQALQNAARASARQELVPVGPRDPKAVFLDQLGKGKAGGGAGAGASQAGGMSGAMGLMMMSQVIDDMQYGRCCRAA